MAPLGSVRSAPDRDDGIAVPDAQPGHLTVDTGEPPMLWTILAILLVLWLLGVIGSVGGGFIHLLLVLAIIVFIAQLLTSRSSSV
jgi:hypothetical protein